MSVSLKRVREIYKSVCVEKAKSHFYIVDTEKETLEEAQRHETKKDDIYIYLVI